ncbi:hypothetical protein Hypma_006727 [Hypsizygus marmoreus]|uniref:Uncharacterized protein n=1 Tax=Hypsizygus marmoreus TaxID=39966 RepID=A0A369JXN8_HYPMA|nr:hypothetical protein Hypma_006727 [Hypsizygus marmoreus]
MNIPGIPLFFDALLTEEETRQLKQELESTERALAGVDAEIALAMEVHKELVRRRNETHHILASYRTSNPRDTGSIRQSISHQELELDRLNREINYAQIELETLLCTNDPDGNIDEVRRCRSIIEQLLRDRDATNCTLERLRGSLSPIRRLPPEVLSEIFLRCQSEEDFIHPAPSKFPHLFSSVCSAWRSVALTTPRLWSSIEVSLTGNVVTPASSIVELWLIRSSSCPLSFKISGQQTSEDALPEQSSAVTTQLLKLFAPHYRRWKKLHLEHIGWDLLPGLSGIPDDGMFPLLESVYLEGTREPADIAFIKKVMQRAPRLHIVSWISLHHHSEINIPWAQLTHIKLTGRILFVEDCLAILHAAPSLRSCSVMVSSPENAPTQHPSFVHQNLERLHIHALGHFSELLTQLTLPHLNVFSVNISYFETGVRPRIWPQTEFIDLITRSECAIETLEFSNVDVSPEGLIECLRVTSPSLQCLEVSADCADPSLASVTDEVLRALTLLPFSPIADQSLVPSLSCLKFWGCLSSSDGVLANMVQSRWMPHTNGEQGNTSQSLGLIMVMLKSAQHPQDISQLETLDATRVSIVRI